MTFLNFVCIMVLIVVSQGLLFGSILLMSRSLGEILTIYDVEVTR